MRLFLFTRRLNWLAGLLPAGALPAGTLAIALASVIGVSSISAQTNTISTGRRIDKNEGLVSPPTKDDTIVNRPGDVIERWTGKSFGARFCSTPFASGSQFTLTIAPRDFFTSIVTLRGNCFGATQGTIILTTKRDDGFVTFATPALSPNRWVSTQAIFTAQGIPPLYILGGPQETLTFELNVGRTRVLQTILPYDVNKLRRSEAITHSVIVP